jgi:hypothetical protein
MKFNFRAFINFIVNFRKTIILVNIRFYIVFQLL